MEKCQKKDRLYNAITKRCYKSCDQKNKDTHPITQKCRKKCKSDKIRRVEDFRCVKKTQKIRQRKQTTKKIHTPNKADTPVETLIPPPLEKALTKNFKFLEELIHKGKGKMVEYGPKMDVSNMITIYFHEKYKQNCPMYPIKNFSLFDTADYKKYLKKNNRFTVDKLKQNTIKTQKIAAADWDQAKFLTNLKLCLETGEELIMIPLQYVNHLNMLLIKVPTREIIRFEPHGDKYKGKTKNQDTKMNKFLEKLTNAINVYLDLNANKKFTFVDPSKICPRYSSPNVPLTFYQGFQFYENAGMKKKKIEGGGFCQLWSWFFAECVINNPTMEVKEVYKEAYDVLKKDESQFASIIRGYFLDINDELVKMNKTFSIKKDYLEKNKTDDIFLDYLKQNRSNLQNKPKKPFVGGLKAKKFILPTVNPKVEPVHF